MSALRIFTIVAALLCVGYINALTTEDQATISAAMRPYVSDCLNKHGVSEEQYTESKKKVTTDGIEPCFYSCVLKAADIFNSNGFYDLQKSLEFGKNNIKSTSGLEFYNKFSTNCAKVNDISDGEEGCERAKQLIDCLHEQMKADNVH